MEVSRQIFQIHLALSLQIHIGSQSFLATLFFSLCYSLNKIVGRKSEYTTHKQIFKGFFLILEFSIKMMCPPRVAMPLMLKEERVRTEGLWLFLELSTLVMMGVH